MGEPVMLVAEDVNAEGAKKFSWMRVRTVAELMEIGEVGHRYEVVYSPSGFSDQPVMPCRFYADIDIAQPENMRDQEYHELAVEAVVEVWNKVCPVQVAARDFLIKACYREDSPKVSFHIVGPDVFFEEVALVRLLMTAVEKAVYTVEKFRPLQAANTSTVFDMAVYRRRGCIRLLGATKFGKPHKFVRESGVPPSRFFIHPYPENLGESMPAAHITELSIDGQRIKSGRSSEATYTSSSVAGSGSCPEGCHCRYSPESGTFEFDLTNPNEYLRKFPINALSHTALITALVAMKKACIPLEHVTALLQFRYRHCVDNVQRVRRKQDFYESFEVSPMIASVRHLISVVSGFGNPPDARPHLFDKPFLTGPGDLLPPTARYQTYEEESGRARAIAVDPWSRRQQSYLAISPMGSGKTFQQLHLVKDALRVEPKATIIVVTCRQLMARDITRRYQEHIPTFVNYLDIKAKSSSLAMASRQINLTKHLIIQLESLHLLDLSLGAMRRRAPLIMVVDEAETIFSQFISSTMEHHYRTSWKTFRSLIENSWLVLFAEALPSQRTYEMCGALCPTLRVERNLTLRLAGTSQRTLVRYEDYSKLVAVIIARVKEGERCGVFCSTKSIAKKIFTLISSAGLASQVYHSEDRTSHGDFENLHSAWSDKQVVIWTSVVTVGVSYDLEHFDFMAAFIGCKGPYIRDCVQAVHRIRNLKKNELLYAANGPFTKGKEKKEEEEEEDNQVFFETDQVMKTWFDDRNSRIEREYRDMVDAADPLIRRLVYYSVYESKLQLTNALADRLFAFFLCEVIGYKFERGISVEENDFDPEVDIVMDWEEVQLYDKDGVPLPFLHETLENLANLSVGIVGREGDEIIEVSFMQQVTQNLEDTFTRDASTIRYRHMVRRAIKFVKWVRDNPFLDVTDKQFLKEAFHDFRGRRTWTNFPEVLHEDLHAASALVAAKFRERDRADGELALVSDRTILHLQTRWALHELFGVKTSYETSEVRLSDDDLVSNASKIQHIYRAACNKEKKTNEPRQLRSMITSVLHALNIGVTLGSQKTQHHNGKRVYKVFWKPNDMAAKGATWAKDLLEDVPLEAEDRKRKEPEKEVGKLEDVRGQKKKKGPVKPRFLAQPAALAVQTQATLSSSTALLQTRSSNSEEDISL